MRGDRGLVEGWSGADRGLVTVRSEPGGESGLHFPAPSYHMHKEG